MGLNSGEHRTMIDFAAYVITEDYVLATHGDDEARRRIAEDLDGVDLYFHAGPHLEDMDKRTAVTIPELLVLGIIPRVTLHRDA